MIFLLGKIPCVEYCLHRFVGVDVSMFQSILRPKDCERLSWNESTGREGRILKLCLEAYEAKVRILSLAV